MRVLIGYDGSSNAMALADDLKRSGLNGKVNAVVLSVADVLLPPAPDKSTPPSFQPTLKNARHYALGALRIAQSFSERGAQLLKKRFPKWTVKPKWRADSPAWGILKEADKEKVDLIALGAHGHSRFGRFIGSVSQMVLVHAKQSVRICRPGRVSKNKKPRIVVGVDGSTGAEAAIKSVASRTWPAGLNVRLVAAVEPKTWAAIRYLTPPEIRWILDKADDERLALERILEMYAKELRKTGATVTCVVRIGDPKRILVREAADAGADCIIVGARGLSDRKRFFLGGVSTAVSARAHCSVEVIRNPRGSRYA